MIHVPENIFLKPNMLLSENINFGLVRFPTMYLVLAMGFVFWVFVMWYEARKDGFDDERFLDLVVVSTVVAVLFYYLFGRLYTYVSLYRPNNPLLSVNYEVTVSFVTLLGAFLPPFYFSGKRRWSLFRVFDIYSLAFGFFLVFISLGRYLITNSSNHLWVTVLTLAFYLGVLRFRGYRFVSGLIFSLFAFYLGIIVLVFFKSPGYLLFSGALFIIGLSNLYYRSKKYMNTRNLPKEFVELIKRQLVKKEKELQKEQANLIKEDPYLEKGRTDSNSEYMDEAILEDTRKSVTDAQLSIVQTALIEVKRALAAIKIGKYGICEVCGEPIDKARLKAYPQATTCLEHADGE
ncbi:MAG: Transcriptional regulator, TraR/DksA family [candidate division WWE3 bacterium GW2011_GWF1_42_14]|uniref:Transcriptional regulator, TraR/DksA family n=2 Tax=Katanobacteria TaxID=422282 RepID=A0A0G0YPS7_UNCKA|nr:MAG: Transcriptional regulator, TraR/DksA family [candidate division WWE3 bacterium GW2011_GWA1_42_12]KKS34312.1 MAG: Transcriptional regulator, TraR/DksA family [candidate division WWE3 bacterium GW2011_GWD1_42_14]KKS38614.1 MAG: Transcriptional regulator, TraR/DksA family [candidate division WWE3 bacterium GW2011_GWF1_42_14]KKS40433.1 MAG: Transcriptional regulator, TraR/DksA family [candidate division WWE3 bacterium GW2011_GWE1_42_16]KKS66330.1 MAG: Transcriptional regulator, TraR/DksA fa